MISYVPVPKKVPIPIPKTDFFPVPDTGTDTPVPILLLAEKILVPIPGYRYSGTDTFTIWKKFDTGTDNDTGIGERGKTECGVIPWVVLFFYFK